MASVEKYEKGGKTAWLVRYTTYVNGKRKQHMKRGFAKERDAKAFASRVEAQIVNNEYVEKSGATLAEYMDVYLSLYCDGLAPKTLESYTSLTKWIKQDNIAARPLQSISAEDIQQYLKRLTEEPRKIMVKTKTGETEQTRAPLSANSALHYFRFLNLIFGRAVLNKKILSSPCETVVKPKAPKHKHVILTVADCKKLLTAAKDTPIYIPILLGGYMGLRRGEALGLTWPDVDFKNQTISVCQARQIINAEERITSLKTEKSRRTLYMPDIVAAALKAHKKNIVIDISHKLVCSATTGEPISISTFTQRYKRALKRAGLPQEIRFHDLRHSAAALLTAAGANPKEVSDYLGHANIGITMDLYADIFDENKKNTAKKLNALLKKS